MFKFYKFRLYREVLLTFLFTLTAGAISAQVTYYSKSTATDFNSTTSWGTNTDGTGTSPSSITNADNYIIQNGSTLSLTGNASVRALTINTGSLTVSANTLTVSIASAFNTSLTINSGGTLTVSGGSVILNGNFALASGGKLTQTAGDITVDGNNGGSTTGSVASGTYIVSFSPSNNADIIMSGGNFTIVDPHTSTTTTFYCNIPTAGHSEASGTHTFKFGNGTSNDAGSTSGFRYYAWGGTGIFRFRNVVIDAGSGTNRFVHNGSSSTYYNFVVTGNMTITSGEYRNANTSTTTGATYIAGNLTNNGTFTNLGAVIFANATTSSSIALSVTASTISQTISGAGTFRNLTASPTANLTNLTVNNSNATGVTLNTPLSVSGTLTMTSGIINTTSTNLLTLGTASAAGTLSGTPSITNYINGPFARTYAAGRTASGTYSVSTLFPVGKGGTYLGMYVDPTTTSGGAVIYTAEAFNANGGSSGAGVSNLASKVWSAIPTSGSSNLTSSFIRLLDGSITATSKVLQSSMASGTYNAVIGGSTSVASTSVTTTANVAGSSLLGYYSYGDLTPCSSPTDTAQNFVTSNKSNTSFTVNFDTALTVNNATGYLVVRDTIGNTVVPSNGTIYSAGSGLTGTVVGTYYTMPFSFTQSGLTASTTYSYFVYSFNNSGCAGPVYYAVPAKYYVTTCASALSAPASVSAANVTTTSMDINYAASTSGTVTNHIIDVATNSGFTSFVPGYQNFSLGTLGNSGSQTASLSGLSPATTYYIRIKAVDGGAGCESPYTSTLTQATACNPVTSFPYNEGFESLTTAYMLPSCVGSSPTVASGGKVQTRIVAATGTNSALTARTGTAYSTIYWSPSATQGWIFSAPLQLTAGVSYDASVYYLTDGVAWTDVGLYLGNAQTSASMTTTISSISSAAATTFTQIKGSFIPSTTGVYYIGVRAYNSNTSPNYCTFDDLKVELTPTPAITSVTSSTACGGSTKVVITGTDMNNITTATIGGVNLLPFDSVSSTRLVKNVMTTAFSGTTSIANSLGTATNGSTLTYTNAPALTLSGSTQTNCSGQTNSSLTTVTSTLSDYNSYIWTPTTGIAGDSAAGWSFNPSSTTTYTLNTTNASGCINSKMMVVTVNTTPSALTLTQGKLPPNCFGSIDSLMVSGGTIGSSAIVGPVSPTAQGGTIGTQTVAWDVSFTVLQNTTLKTIDIFPMTSGESGSISVRTSAGSVISTYSFTTSVSGGATPQTITLNHVLTPGSYQLYPSLPTSGIRRNTSGAVYPYSSTHANITANGFDQTYFMGFYNWQFANSTPTTKSWSPTSGLYTNRAATIAYVGGDSAKVYTKPTSTTKYYLTVANGTCTRIDSIVDSVKSASTNAALATSNISGATSQCADPSGWTYYEDPSDANKLVFAIKKGTSGLTGESVSIEVGSNFSSTLNTASGGFQNQAFLMGRNWNVTGTIPSGTVDVRFFYDPNDTVAVNTLRDNAFSGLGATSSVKSNFEWFKTVGVPYDASWRNSIVGNAFPSTHIKLSPIASGTINGVNYVDFTVSSFSGGTGGSGFGAPGGTGGVGLPVTWAGFDAKANEAGNKLVWKTASEVNTDYFQVEYSYDGSNFNSIQENIKAAGNSKELKEYQYNHIDFNPYVYYRIKQVDLDGRFDYSEKRIVKRTSGQTFKVQVFPIPMVEDGLLNVYVLSIDKSTLNLKLTDASGKVVLLDSYQPENGFLKEVIDLNSIGNGLYFLEVSNGQGKEVIKIKK